MKSWIFVAGVAIMGVASITGLQMTVARISHRVESSARKTTTETPYTPRKKGAVTYSRDIAPILNSQCAPCHRAGEVAPFALLSYQDAKKRAAQISLVTAKRFMPPWKAEHGFGEFAGERRLTPEQIGLIQQWAEDGAPEGNRAALPPAPKFPEGWTLGKPDAILEPKEIYTLAASGDDVYRCFVLPTNFTEDRYIAAFEARPGSRGIVHHVIAYLDTSGKARELDAKDPGPGYTTFGGLGFLPSGALGGWAPGLNPTFLPSGVGALLPRRADVVLQVHYHKTGKEETDKTRIGIYFCKQPVDKIVRVLPLVDLMLRIPAGEANYNAKASMPITADVTALQVTPHMHLLGRDMKIEATLPDQSKMPLVHVADWDFNWQTAYQFKTPLKLPKGSRINMTARYDNSPQNPRNPSNPPRTVTWGEQTTDEMCIAFIAYTVDSEHLTKGVSAAGFPDFGNRRGSAGAGGGQRLRGLLKSLRNAP